MRSQGRLSSKMDPVGHALKGHRSKATKIFQMNIGMWGVYLLRFFVRNAMTATILTCDLTVTFERSKKVTMALWHVGCLFYTFFRQEFNGDDHFDL